MFNYKVKKEKMFSSQTGHCKRFNSLTSIATPFYSKCSEPAFLTDFHEKYENACDDVSPVFKQWQQSSPFDARNSLIRRENSRIISYAPCDINNRPQYCEKPLIVENENGDRKIVCPVIRPQIATQCLTALRTLFNCEQRYDIGSPAYNVCKKYRDMIYFNLVSVSGNILPLGFDASPEGLQLAKRVLTKAQSVCATCQVDSVLY